MAKLALAPEGAADPQPKPEIKWDEVGSSNVKSIVYGQASKTLGVEFANGGFYAYTGVTPEHYLELKGAISVGQYLNKVIKVYYPYSRFESRDELMAAL